MDYQKTLNLPKTDFSMKAGLTQKEPQMLAAWEQSGLYAKIRAKSAGRKNFILHDGPPYANGNIHIGHALNKILKDIIVKYKTMQGFDSIYIPGWDCHGLPIEHALLKDLKTKKTDINCLDLRHKAHDYAMKFVATQRDQFKRLGIMGEWDRPYLTLAPAYEFWILKMLSELAKKDYIYRARKPVNWCFDCETALAEAEVEYENHTSPTVFVRFPVRNPEVIPALKGKKVSLLIWTTTPWTLLANVAVAVSPIFDYVLADLGDEILILEKTLSVAVFGKAPAGQEPKPYKIIGEVKGEALTKLVYTHPFGKRENCPVVAVDYVTKEDGTGLVHTAPGHGQDDYQTGLKYKLPILMPVNDRGVFTADGAPFEGKHVLKANDEIIEHLRAQGLLFHAEKIQHSYPHCWRCKKPIIFRATYQWFLKIDHNDLRQKIKGAIEKDVQWFPAAGEERIKAMVSTRPDWCLSRQRYWGVPIPAVRLKGSEDQHLFPEVVEHIAKLVREQGSNIWFEKDLKDLWPKDFPCPLGKVEDLEKANDILDVWFDSGVSHQAVFHEMLKKPLPADLYLEGSDQHRGWFQSSIIPSVAIDGRPPYRQVLTHGFVVDGEGRKMSKSLGNVIAPNDVITQSGADILRLWVASSSYNDDIRLSKEIMDRLVDAYRKIRNTARYLLSNLDGFDPDTGLVPVKDMLLIDRWALSRFALLIDKVTAAFEVYDFAEVYKAVYSFCNEDLSSIYLDILKDRLYTCSAHALKRRSAQTVLYHISDGISRILAPVLSFTADEIFASIPKAKAVKEAGSIHLLDWPRAGEGWLDKAVEEQLGLLLEIRPFVLKALEDKRAAGLIGSPLEAKVIFRTASARDSQYLKGLLEQLPSYFIVSQVKVEDAAAVENAIGGTFAQTSVIVEHADGVKCPRCWNYKTDIGLDKDHPEVCGRCARAVKGLDSQDKG
ncbi:MAG: isoleucine--tRNA ligase [Candidatus Omnitrophica bacterium]|nr:isoleucine--tRNA ligase [Candidatus Omnitrophota bacterium]